MTDIGATLRAAREAQGLTLADVEARTRIRARMLEDLENNDLDLVRGDPHLRGFLGNYARFLGLDPAPMLESLGITSQTMPNPRSAARDSRYLAEPLQTSPVPLGRILFTLAVLLALGFAAFYLWGPQSFRDTLLASANRIAGPTASPAITAIVSPTADIAMTNTPVVVTQTITTTTIIEPFRSPTPEDGGATAVPTATLPPRTPTPDAEAIAATETAVAQATADTFQGVVVRAEFLEDSYIYLQADDNPDLIFDGVLPAGETAEWRGNQEIYITIGNAGGVRVNVNGQDLGVLGEPGEVVERTWTVDPEGGPPIEETFD